MASPKSFILKRHPALDYIGNSLKHKATLPFEKWLDGQLKPLRIIKLDTKKQYTPWQLAEIGGCGVIKIRRLEKRGLVLRVDGAIPNHEYERVLNEIPANVAAEFLGVNGVRFRDMCRAGVIKQGVREVNGIWWVHKETLRDLAMRYFSLIPAPQAHKELTKYGIRKLPKTFYSEVGDKLVGIRPDAGPGDVRGINPADYAEYIRAMQQKMQEQQKGLPIKVFSKKYGFSPKKVTRILSGAGWKPERIVKGPANTSIGAQYAVIIQPKDEHKVLEIIERGAGKRTTDVKKSRQKVVPTQKKIVMDDNAKMMGAFARMIDQKIQRTKPLTRDAIMKKAKLLKDTGWSGKWKGIPKKERYEIIDDVLDSMLEWVES